MTDLSQLVLREFPVVEQTYTWRDTILYALGCGYGTDPEDLPFVYERDLQAVPTMASVLASPGMWYDDAGMDITKLVHAAEQVTIHQPLPPSGTVRGQTRVLEVIDRGRNRGVLIISARDVIDVASGHVLATVRQTAFCRGDGGRGGTSRDMPVAHHMPDRAPDAALTLPTVKQAALIYRLSGDLNPLHVDPAAAALAGFERPILHGLATFGVIGHALLRHVCGNDPTRLRSMSCRFARPVFPGQDIRTDLWQDGEAVSFRAAAGERFVADQGMASVAAG